MESWDRQQLTTGLAHLTRGLLRSPGVCASVSRTVLQLLPIHKPSTAACRTGQRRPSEERCGRRGGEEREVLRQVRRDAENKLSACVKRRGKDGSEEELSEVVGRRRKGERIRPDSG